MSSQIPSPSSDGEYAALPAQTRQWLLQFARECMAAAIAEPAALPRAAPPPSGAEEPRGCFVTLHTRGGDLRGCIGTFESSGPLWQTVQEMAVAAALRDPRFHPLRPEELPRCVLEISALTPLRPARAEEVEVGRHGVCVQRGFSRGVLLPQVATEHGWDRETFLDHTCRKAGLPLGAWRDGSVRIEVFTAEVFSEVSAADDTPC